MKMRSHKSSLLPLNGVAAESLCVCVFFFTKHFKSYLFLLIDCLGVKRETQ